MVVDARDKYAGFDASRLRHRIGHGRVTVTVTLKIGTKAINPRR